MHQRWDQDIKCQDQDQVTFKTENKTKTVKTLSLLETVARDSRPWCAFMFSVCRVKFCQFFCCFVTVYSVELTMGSPSPSNSTPPSSLSNSSESDLNCCESLTRCGACGGPLVLPKVLTCFHAFCRPCLERIEESRRITCPSCHVETYLSAEGVSGLLPYFGPSGTAIKDN